MEFEINNEMADFIENSGAGSIDTLKAYRLQINEIAAYCRKSGLYKHSEEKVKEFTKNMTALEIYQHMLTKVANAPTTIHARGAGLLFMPMIADKLAVVE